MMSEALREQEHAAAVGHPADMSSYVIFIFLTCLHHQLSLSILSILKNKVCVTVFAWQLFLLHGL